MRWWLAVVVCCCIAGAQAGCRVDEIPVMQDFNMTQMMGVWYETHWAPPYFEKAEEVWYDYVEVWAGTDDPGRVTAKAYGRPVNSTACGSFNKSYRKSVSEESAKWWTPRYINSSYSFPMDQWFIGTDYSSWALVYSCVLPDPASGECTEVAAWVWSRAQTLSGDDRDAVDALLPSVCLSFGDLNEMPVGEECPRSDDASSASFLTSSAQLLCLLFSLHQGLVHGSLINIHNKI